MDSMQEKKKQPNDEEPQKVTNASKELKTITGDIKRDTEKQDQQKKRFHNNKKQHLKFLGWTMLQKN